MEHVQYRKNIWVAVLTFIFMVILQLDKNNVSEVFQDKYYCKKLINKHVEYMERQEHRERAKYSQYWWNRDKNGFLAFFRNKVINLVVYTGECESSRILLNRKRDLAPRFMTEEKFGSRVKAQNQAKKNSSPLKTVPQYQKGSKWSTPCLSPKLPDLHWFRDCLQNTPELRKKRVDDYQSKKRAAAKYVSCRKPSLGEPNAENYVPENYAEDGNFRVILEDKVDVVELGDYGADFSEQSVLLPDKITNAQP